jgi:hypothetical protein
MKILSSTTGKLIKTDLVEIKEMCGKYCICAKLEGEEHILKVCRNVEDAFESMVKISDQINHHPDGVAVLREYSKF